MMINHNEAWYVACQKQKDSNLARCYMDVIELLQEISDGGYIKTKITYNQTNLEDRVDQILNARDK